MGAGQSSGSANGARVQEAVKTSYYDLLGLDKTASEDDIKKAYRRKALELHPDRNYGDVERTTALFSEIQSAHQVLSDPQERAWYDSHEDAILHDSDPTVGNADGAGYEQKIGLTRAEDITRMIRKFNGNVEFSDAPSGFFGFLRDTFEQLSTEEEDAALRERVDIPDYPHFGHKEDDHETVKIFYNVWSAFSTRKTFAWRDRHRVSDAEDRWMRRQMEKENKQFRTEARQEFNDAVRSLVAFIKKRDPRYIPNVQSESQRQKALRDAAQAQASRMRAANQAKLNEEVPEWTKTTEADDMDEITEEESEEEHFECVACHKTFKSENQFATHEKSKKHQKTVYALRKELEKEGMDLGLHENHKRSSALHTPAHDEPEIYNVDNSHGSAGQPLETHDRSIAEVEQACNSHVINQTTEQSISEPSAHLSGEPSTNASSDEAVDDAKDYSPVNTALEGSLAGTEHSSEGWDPLPAKRLGKAAQKRAKRAAQLESASQLANPHACIGCSAVFPSKKKLFDHLKDHPGHAAPKYSIGTKGKK